uniref:Ribosomal protein S11 n=1 Tax=Choreocolax polysiphoniae TaxID=282351 RepID=A0A1J0F7B1_9FLOR|nr:ribosomal protein S11 [Choreocolax polysiphoniae]APC24880.1 ribosomal protein S11 [Choreocolax polysiphoniae]
MFKIYFLFILFTQNNIFITLSNYQGNTYFWKSIGFLKSKKSKKLTLSLFKNFINFYLLQLNNIKNSKLHIKLKGFNKCKKLMLKNVFTLFSKKILSISDNTNNATNGCKLKKKRRL